MMTTLPATILEDLVTIVDGRPQLVDEIRDSPEPVRSYIAKVFGKLLQKENSLTLFQAIFFRTKQIRQEWDLLVERLSQIAEL